MAAGRLHHPGEKDQLRFLIRSAKPGKLLMPDVFGVRQNDRHKLRLLIQLAPGRRRLWPPAAVANLKQPARIDSGQK
jgi:hypothetical protein